MRRIQLETSRLILRPMLQKDAPFLLALLNSPDWLKWIGDRNVHTITAAKNYIKTRMTKQWNEKGFGNFLVIQKSDGAKIGACGIYARPGLDNADLGYAFLPPYQGMGYATEAAQRVRDFGSLTCGLDIIAAITLKEHVASQKVLHKTGFKYKENITLDKNELMLFEYRRDSKPI